MERVGRRKVVHLEHASRATMSDFMYQRAAGEASRYFPIGRGSVLAARVRAG